MVTIGFSRAAGGPHGLFPTPDYVFMTVIPVDADGQDIDDPIYSNLDDPNALDRCYDVNYFRRVLAELGIAVPESMFRETMRDQSGGVGNRDVYHSN